MIYIIAARQLLQTLKISKIRVKGLSPVRTYDCVLSFLLCYNKQMLHFIVDGYNVLHKTDMAPGADIEYLRDGFVHDVRCFLNSMKGRNKATVVFDGSPRCFTPVKNTDPYVKVIFSVDEEADDVIVRLSAGSKQPKNIIVVTDDRKVKDKVKQYGTQLISSSEFIRKLRSAPLKKCSKEEKEVLSDKAAAVNRELLDYWEKKYG